MTAANAPQHAGALDGTRRGRILRRALLAVCVLVLVLGVTVYCHAREAGTPDCSHLRTAATPAVTMVMRKDRVSRDPVRSR